MTRRVGRTLATALATIFAIFLVLPLLPASAEQTPAPEGGEMWITPSRASAGTEVQVGTSGWAPGTQLQAVVCGQLGLKGSSSCHLPGAVTAASNAEGEAVHTLTVGRPPEACPCVVRVTTFTAPAQAMNVPLEVIGHRVADVVIEDEEAVSSDLRVEKVELEGRGGISAFLGLGGSTTMSVTFANRGNEDVEAPAVAIGFGRGDVDTQREVDPGVTVPAQGQARFEVELDVPLLAFGEQRAVAAWADGAGSVRSDGFRVYPFGALVLLLALLVGIIVVDVRRSGWGRFEELLETTPGAHRFIDDDGSYPLPEVVYLEDIGGYLVKPTLLKNSKISTKVSGRVSVDDLAKLVEGNATALYPNGEPAAAPVGSGGLSQFIRGELLRRGEGGVGSGPGLNFFVRGERRRDDHDGPFGSGSGMRFFVRNDRHRDL